MKNALKRKPSASMVVSIIALVVALSGSAVAATQMNGDSLIQKDSLSGNRLRNQTVTGQQLDKSRLGTVPRAGQADVANNATKLGGRPPDAYMRSSALTRSGIVQAGWGQSVPVTAFGPFTMKLVCSGNPSTGYQATLDLTSNVPYSEFGGKQMNPGVPVNLNTSLAAASTFKEQALRVADVADSKGLAYSLMYVVGENFPGTPNANCFTWVTAVQS